MISSARTSDFLPALRPRVVGRPLGADAFVGYEGRRFGRLTVERQAPKLKRKICYVCRCDCGNSLIVQAGNLASGHTQSCGCLKVDVQRKLIVDRSLRHGRWNTAEYRTWLGLRQRCTNPKSKSWRHYGGRGITVCDRWMNSFENFFADMGEKPSPQHSIDRIDVNGNYEPNNCRWATSTEQALNKRPGRPFGTPGGSKASAFPAFTAARMKNRWSCAAVAAKVTEAGEPTSSSAVHAWENNAWKPSESRLDALAELFRVHRAVVERWFGLEFVAVHR